MGNPKPSSKEEVTVLVSFGEFLIQLPLDLPDHSASTEAPGLISQIPNSIMKRIHPLNEDEAFNNNFWTRRLCRRHLKPLEDELKVNDEKALRVKGQCVVPQNYLTLPMDRNKISETSVQQNPTKFCSILIENVAKTGDTGKPIR